MAKYLFFIFLKAWKVLNKLSFACLIDGCNSFMYWSAISPAGTHQVQTVTYESWNQDNDYPMETKLLLYWVNKIN